jgi:ElaB/YqjD/DUF883 family membrane-anchored ribosome-binding protein
MVQKTAAIRQHIEAQRAELGENLQFLEHRVRKAADWRTWVQERPLIMVGAAFGVGLLLSRFVGSRCACE